MYSTSVTQTKISYYGEIMETKPFLRLACVDRVPSFRGDAKDLVAVVMVRLYENLEMMPVFVTFSL
jgi:hypothetical protein